MNVRILKYLAAVLLFLPTACDVHQFPITEEEAEHDLNVTVHLEFNTDMTVWEHVYDVNSGELKAVENASATVYDNTQTAGKIRHILRVYPYTEHVSNLGKHLYEYLFFETLDDKGYDFVTTLTLPKGDYIFMGWSDIIPTSEQAYLHDVSEFAQIQLVDHRINTDYRDAFRGTAKLCVKDVAGKLSDESDPEVYINMRRPMAKFEIIADGIDMFLEQQAQRNGSRQNFNDYKIAIAYAGYMPYAYNVLTDAIVDSKYREVFISSPTIIDNSSASLGFDYALIRDGETTAPVQIAVYDVTGEQIAATDPISIPLRRDYHTVVRGRFFEAHSSGGSVGIDPSFEGDFNIIR